MDVRPLPVRVLCAINELHENDSIEREQRCIADRWSHHCTQHVTIHQGQCSCRQSGVALHVIEGDLLDGGQTRSCVFVEESKPAAHVLGKQVGADSRHEITFFLTFVARGTLGWFPLAYHVKQTRQERQNYRACLKQLDQMDHQSFACPLSDFLGSLSNFSFACTVSVAFFLPLCLSG
jgi:hypothetical protein